MVSNIKPSLQFALQLRNQGELDKASKIYQQLIELEPNNPIAYDRLAQVQAQQGFFADAIDNYQQAIKLGVDSPFWTYKNLGDSLRENGQFERATSAYQKAIQLNPKNPIAYDALGQVSSMMGNFAESIANYKKAIALGINNPSWTYKNLEEALIKENRFDEADTIRQNFIASQEKRSLDNQDVAPPKEEIELSVDNAGFDDLQAKNDEREELKQEAVIPETKKWLELHQEGDRYFIEGKWQTAKSFYQQAIELNQDYFWSHYNLGKTLMELKEIEAAISNFKAAINLSSVQPFQVYLATGRIYETREEFAAATETYKQGVEIFGNVKKSFFLEELERIKREIKKYPPKPAPAVSQGATVSAQEKLFPHLDDEAYISCLYKTFLGRQVDPQGLAGNLNALQHNVPRRIILENILKTPEFINKNRQSILEELEDGDFLQVIWELLLGRSCEQQAKAAFLNNLSNGLSRTQAICEITKSQEFKDRLNNLDLLNPERTRTVGNVWIMGTDRFLNQADWDLRLFQVLRDRAQQKIGHSQEKTVQKKYSATIEDYLSLSTVPLVSIITSLYKGRDYIKHFLDNITSQSIFELSELIIIDANSPENEFEIIEEYLQRFDNIRYLKTERTIGIYEAWNIGIQESRGQFLTNANLDDLRRQDCLEKQAEALIQNYDVDLVYQDFYYSLTPNLPFEVIEACGYKSQLPAIADRSNMLTYNPPHNAPMWRKSLHDRVGLFNIGYKSAGDYELWMRGLLDGAKYIKIDEPVAVYYNNPKGISTRKEGKGAYEAKEIQVIYENLFQGEMLSIGVEDFVDRSRNGLGFTGKIEQINNSESEWYNKITFLDKCFIDKLKELGKSKFYLNLNS